MSRVTLYPSAPLGSVTTSPSAFGTMAECERKWANGRLLGVPEPDKASAILGTKTHKIAENYGKTGKVVIDPFDSLAGELFESVRPHLAIIGAEHEREFWYAVEGVPGIMHGLIDVFGPAPPRPKPLVQDIKTTSDWKWAKRAADLDADPQANLYTLFAVVLCGSDEADLEWLYTITKGTRRECRPTRHTITRTAAERYVEQTFAPVAERIVQLTRKHRESPATSSEDFEPNPNACSMYGGCAYRFTEHCKLSAAASFAALYNQSTESKSIPMTSLVDQLANFQGLPPVQQAAPAQAAPLPLPLPAAGGPVPLPQLAPEAPAPGTMAYEAAQATPLPPGTCAPNGKLLPPTVIASGVMRIDTGFAAIHKLFETDAAKASQYLNLAADRYEIERNAPPVNPPEQAIAPTDAEQRAAIASGNETAAVTGQPVPAPEAPKAKRGRPKKSKTDAAPGAAALLAPSGDEVVLYIDCIPVGEVYTDLSSIFVQAHGDITAADPKVLDFGMIPYEGSGRFRVYCEARFQHAIEAGERAFVCTNSQSREASIALASLASAADRVVKGV